MSSSSAYKVPDLVDLSTDIDIIDLSTDYDTDSHVYEADNEEDDDNENEAEEDDDNENEAEDFPDAQDPDEIELDIVVPIGVGNLSKKRPFVEAEPQVGYSRFSNLTEQLYPKDTQWKPKHKRVTIDCGTDDEGAETPEMQSDASSDREEDELGSSSSDEDVAEENEDDDEDDNEDDNNDEYDNDADDADAENEYDSWHCTQCGVDMGKQNPRQLCGKTFCHQFV